MYLVSINNNGINREIHGHLHKVSSGKIIKGINTIDSFSFALNPSNIGFNELHDYKTLVEVYNTNKNRYEFQGRVLSSTVQMNESGFISKEVTCESFFGYLCDSVQEYVEEKNWTVRGLLEHIVNKHNGQVETEKRFTVRTVGVTDPNNNLYVGIQRENTWETIKKKLIDVLGGELSFEVNGNIIYLDYMPKLGALKGTQIALSRNMKAITREKDPTAFITRLIPLGAKIAEDTEERLTIAEASGQDGKIYIDDTQAIEEYGIHVGYVEFDDVTEVDNLVNKGRKWLTENNKVQVKYSITALDLSLLGKDIDDFEVCNEYPIENALLGIEDTARIIKKTIDICEEIKSTIEIGDNFKTLSEIQRERAGSVTLLANAVGVINANYVTNAKLNSTIETERSYTSSLINQLSDEISLIVEKTDGGNVINSAAIIAAINNDESTIVIEADKIDLQGAVTADYIEALGITVEATQITGKLTANQIDATSLTVSSQNITGKLTADQIDVDSLAASMFSAGYTVTNGTKNLTIKGDGLTQYYSYGSSGYSYKSLLDSMQLMFIDSNSSISSVIISRLGVQVGTKVAYWEDIINAANN